MKRNFLLRHTLAVTAVALVGWGVAQAQIAIPSDIGVTLSATPSTNLVTGQPIDVTVSVTNYGPEPAPQIGVVSSTFVNEFGQFVTNPSECFLFVTVVDAVPTAHYYINWDVANVLGVPGSQPLNAGETRTCHFQFALTSSAPAVVRFSLLVPSFFSDVNPSNDSATVILQRAPHPIPALSTPSLLLLAGFLVLVAAIFRRHWSSAFASAKWLRGGTDGCSRLERSKPSLAMRAFDGPPVSKNASNLMRAAIRITARTTA